MCDTKDLILKKIANKMKIHYKMLYLRMKNWIGTQISSTNIITVNY